jgi:DNA polymerase-3 subunit delta
VLLYGADAMRVALRRQALLGALVGPKGNEEMRLTRLAGPDLRRDPAALMDAMKAICMYPGPRAVHVEGATDQVAPGIVAALGDWREGDATLVITAGSLTARSALRKAFEGHRNAYAAGIYDDPPDRAEIEAMIRKAGLAQVGPEAMADLTDLARAVDPGDLGQIIEKLALYKHGDPSAVTSADLAAVAPATTEAELDTLLNAVAEAEVARIPPLVARLSGQGEGAVRLCIGASQHFRRLYAAATDPGGPAAGIARARPPVFGPARNRMIRQAQSWGAFKLETALAVLVDTDLALRSAQKAPHMALMERALIRIAMLGAQR